MLAEHEAVRRLSEEQVFSSEKGRDGSVLPGGMALGIVPPGLHHQHWHLFQRFWLHLNGKRGHEALGALG